MGPLNGRRTRRPVVVAGVVLALLAAASGAVAFWPDKKPSVPGCQIGAALQPSCGSWWGAALNTNDAHLKATVTATESRTDRRLDIVHTYHRWDDPFPTSSERSLIGSGHLLFANWEPVQRDDTAMSWGDIAAGRADQVIRSEAVRLAAVGRPILVSFSHEPELDYRSHGSISDYAAAFRHVVTVVRSAGATQVRWVWDLMGLSDPVWQQRYPSMWPGSAYVDWIAWDPYNWASCRGRTWLDFTATVQPFYRWISQQAFAAGKPLMLAEYGTIEGSGPNGKAGWLAGVPAALQQMPRLRALVYFNLPAPPANCDWLVTTSPSATAAFAALARNGEFRWPASQSPLRR
jgi:hypothetical protein